MLNATVRPANGGPEETFLATAVRTEGETIDEQERVFTLEDDTERRFKLTDYWFDVQDVES